MSILSRIFGTSKPVKTKTKPGSARVAKSKNGAGAAMAAHSKDGKSFGKSGQNAQAAAKKS